MLQGSSGSSEAVSGLVGQGGDPFGPQDRREGAKQAGEPTGRHDGHAVGDHLAPGDLGAVDGHDRHHHLGVGQDLGGSVGLEGHRPQDGGEGGAAMPQPTGWVELEAASILLGVHRKRREQYTFTAAPN
jgi:hypothetical protein